MAPPFRQHAVFKGSRPNLDGKNVKLQADVIDLPVTAAICNPKVLIPEALYRAAPSSFMLSDTSVAENYYAAGPNASERDEYVTLVLGQLTCGTTHYAVGDVLCFAKAATGW